MRLLSLFVGAVVFASSLNHALCLSAQDDQLQETVKEVSAEHFLKHLNDPGPYSLDGQLSPAEAEKVVEFLRKQFPFESVRERLKYESGDRLPRHTRMHSAAKKDEDEPREYYPLRARALEKLHSDKAAEFITSAGFGFERIRRESPYDLRFDRGEIALDTEYHSAVEFAGEESLEIGQATHSPTSEEIKSLHEQSMSMFASSESNGLVRNVDEVAGFEPHGLSYLPTSGIVGQKPEEEGEPVWWKINRLELVGLLMHDHYVVYKTDKLPNMELLDDVPTRNLDEFEVQALGQLLSGENLIARGTTNRVRMLGALRAADQCLQCHSVKKGELLGAFSYELLRKPPQARN